MATRKQTDQDRPRQNRARPAGEMVGEIGGVAFKRFGFVQGAVVSRWKEIVGDRYARVSTPESIRFPAGKKSGGTLTLSVEGAHAPLMQHMTPMIIERVNRFFGYPAVARLSFRQGRAAARPRPRAAAAELKPVPVPADVGENLRTIADPELRACLEALAVGISRSTGLPRIGGGQPLPNPVNSTETP
ncbi:DUF721 domain-containing protein [Sphingomonas ginkgonis]|uniref:DUF721 domain-containing protein n=1 Tax=Sphingomonas ginkgonis TaxID=2315330 RepID=A0A429V7V4_9SPHN|nr:DciA family protein [Sphingomonas ginkgonis]RST29947.1 DUF721 domain-containing protein [Sphingomonas ginkgonis]